MKILVRSVLAIALACVLAGCAQTSTPAEESAPASTSSAEQAAEQQDESQNAGGVAVDPTTLLTPADVESVSGLSGLKVVPYDPSIGAGGKVNIATADGQLVAMLVFEGPDVWEAWNSDGVTFGQEYTPTVGDESFTGPAEMDTPYIFAFRNGDNAVVIDTFFDAGATNTILTVEQLAELARLVDSRL